MDHKFNDKILEAFKMKSIEYSDQTRKGILVTYKAITFGEIHRYIKKIHPNMHEQYFRPRKIKKQLNELIAKKIIVEVNGEPPVYMLPDEFDKFKPLYNED